MTTEPGSVESSTASSPPPLPEAPQQEDRLGWKLSTLLATRFWWILAGAALIKLVAYFIAPQPPSTLGGHVGALLRGFIVFGASLSVVALIACQFFREKARMFRVVFAGLFALACLLNLPSACALRYAYTNANNAAAEFAAASSAFEALMKYERSTFLRDEYRETGRMTQGLLGRLEREQVKTGRVLLRGAETDAMKFLNLSFCYATGFEEYPKDISKAIQLCQRAASESYLWRNDRHHYSQKATIDKARELLRKSGLSWPGAEN